MRSQILKNKNIFKLLIALILIFLFFAYADWNKSKREIEKEKLLTAIDKQILEKLKILDGLESNNPLITPDYNVKNVFENIYDKNGWGTKGGGSGSG